MARTHVTPFIAGVSDGDEIDVRLQDGRRIFGLVTWVNRDGVPPYAMVRQTTGRMMSLRDRDVVTWRVGDG